MKSVFWGLRLLGGFHALRAGLVTMLAESVARSARYIIGSLHPTLRATPGACVGLSMVSRSARCRFATKWRDDMARISSKSRTSSKLSIKH